MTRPVKRLTIFDYGAGNLHSLAKALDGPARSVRLERDPRAALDTDVLVLPGVGAFGPAAERLAPAREEMRARIAAGLPTLGICLGMQLLFDESEEGEGRGLGVFAGRVERLRAARTPQIGWNGIEYERDGTCADARDAAPPSGGLTIAYYANRYVCRAERADDVVAWSTHESDRFAAVVRSGDCLGVQFHPEKSSAPGIRFLDTYLDSL